MSSHSSEKAKKDPSAQQEKLEAKFISGLNNASFHFWLKDPFAFNATLTTASEKDKTGDWDE